MPHRHQEDRVYTVMSGVFHIGVGEHFDGNNLEAHPPGRKMVRGTVKPARNRCAQIGGFSTMPIWIT